MSAGLWPNVRTNLAYYRRSRLVLICWVVLAFFLLQFVLMAVFVGANGGKLQAVAHLLSGFSGFAVLFTGILALAGIATQLHNRSYELVVSRPCLPDTWILSHFAAAALVGAVLQVLILLAGILLMLAFGIPLQWGILYVALHHFCEGLIFLSFAGLLAVLFHPALAVILALLLSPQIIGGFLELVLGGLRVAHQVWLRIALHAVQAVLTLVYYVLPVFSPHPLRSQHINVSLSFAPGDLGILGIDLVYSLAVVALCFGLASLALRRRSV